MGELLAWLLGIGIAIAIIVFVVWITVAILVRVFSLVIVYWVVCAVVGFAAGMIVGVLLPVRVLRGQGTGKLWQIVPDDVVAGRVLGAKPRGPNREYGWDRAWPNYIPQQAKQDALAVRREVSGHLTASWAWAASKSRRNGSGSSQGAGRVFAALARGVPGVLWWMAIFFALVTYSIGIYLSLAIWLIVMGLLGVAVTGLQACGLGLSKAGDVVRRRRLRATVKCPHPPCYGESSLPGYRCSNPECAVVHWTMLPGPLGLRHRRCGCGQVLPNTVSGAARRLQPVCPYCQRNLPVGGGIRQTVQIAVIGSVCAGKSRLLSAMTVTLETALGSVGGTLTPLAEQSAAFRATARAQLRQQSPTPKTQYEPPVGLPFAISLRSNQIEAQVMDVAGEAFSTWDDTAKLRYLDNADGLIMVVDPLALPDVYDVFRRSPLYGTVKLVTDDQEDAYAAAIDRLRADQVHTEKRGLAVVLTKGDILMQLSAGEQIDPTSSASIRQWLLDNGADLMVRRFDKDFREVSFFVSDAKDPRDIRDPLSPWRSFDWLLKESRAALDIGAAVKAA